MFEPPRGAFFVAYRDGVPVATGAWRLRDDVEVFGTRRTAEIKRMYVAPAARGFGVARRMLSPSRGHRRRSGRGGDDPRDRNGAAGGPGPLRECRLRAYRELGYYRESPENRCYGRRLPPSFSRMFALALPRLITVPAALPSSNVIRRAVTFKPRLSDWSVRPVWILIRAASRAECGRLAQRQRVGLPLEGEHAGNGAVGVAAHQAAAAIGDQVDPAHDAVDGQRRVAGAERHVGDLTLGPGTHPADPGDPPVRAALEAADAHPGDGRRGEGVGPGLAVGALAGQLLGTMSPMWERPPTRSASAAQPEPPITACGMLPMTLA